MSSLVLTVAAVVIAIAAIGYAWRLARQERRRAEARVAALAAAIDGTPSVVPAAPVFESETRTFEPEASMFEPEPRTGLQGRPLLKIVAGFAMAVLVIVLIAMSGDFHDQPADAAQATDEASAVPTLELLSMRHVRSGNGLKVTGLVRSNAAAGDPSMMAVVFVFDRDGGFVASGRAPLEFGAIARGDESPFQVTIPDVKDVGRYRVSFRTTAGLVPHVDRRAALQVSAN